MSLRVAKAADKPDIAAFHREVIGLLGRPGASSGSGTGAVTTPAAIDGLVGGVDVDGGSDVDEVAIVVGADDDATEFPGAAGTTGSMRSSSCWFCSSA